MAEAEVQLHSFLNLAGNGGDWSNPFPSHLNTKERTPGWVGPWATRISAVCQFFFSWCDSPLVGLGLLFIQEDFCGFLITHNTPQSVGLLWMSDQLVTETSTWHTTLTTNIHAPGGIQTHDLSRRVAIDLCLRPHSHWKCRSLSIGREKYDTTDYC